MTIWTGVRRSKGALEGVKIPVQMACQSILASILSFLSVSLITERGQKVEQAEPTSKHAAGGRLDVGKAKLACPPAAGR